MAFDFTGLGIDENEQETTSSAVIGAESRKKNRRKRIDRANYDRMQRIERQKLALDKLQSDEFQTVLKRYYSGGITDMNNSVTGGKNIQDFTKDELIEKFYQDRIWSEYNTVGIVKDVSNVLTKDETYKNDWAEITQVYADLPYFGSQTIGFTKWAKDFVPALIVDPINLYTLGTGKVVAREAGKTAITELTKKQFQLQASKKAALEIGKKEAIIGAISIAPNTMEARIDGNFGDWLDGLNPQDLADLIVAENNSMTQNYEKEASASDKAARAFAEAQYGIEALGHLDLFRIGRAKV